jgi:hypothetical protein
MAVAEIRCLEERWELRAEQHDAPSTRMSDRRWAAARTLETIRQGEIRTRATKSAILLDPLNSTFNLQLERIVRCAGNSARRVFWRTDELHAWMEGEKTEHERRALAELFADGDRDSTPSVD